MAGEIVGNVDADQDFTAVIAAEHIDSDLRWTTGRRMTATGCTATSRTGIRHGYVNFLQEGDSTDGRRPASKAHTIHRGLQRHRCVVGVTVHDGCHNHASKRDGALCQA